MPYTPEQEKFVSSLSRGMYIYFKGSNDPYEVLKVYGYVDPNTGEERKAVQYRLGAVDDPRAKIDQKDIDEVDMKRQPFVRGKSADQEAGQRITGGQRFKKFAKDLLTQYATSDAGDYQNPGKAIAVWPGQSPKTAVGRALKSSKYKDRSY